MINVNVEALGFQRAGFELQFGLCCGPVPSKQESRFQGWGV